MKRNETTINAQITFLKRVIGQLVSKGTNYALIDFPDHSNVGDSAIWLGEIKLLSQLTGNTPSYICNFKNFDAEKLVRALPVGPIFLHGGGNFGEVWPRYQEFREHIMAKFQGRKIIQLPQTVSFRQEVAISKCAKSIEQQSNFHLLVRDKPSLEFCKNHFQCPIELAPDTAFALGPLKASVPSSHDVFMLMREDSERANYNRSSLNSVSNSLSTDWIEEPITFNESSKKISAIKAFLAGSWGVQEYRLVYYQQLASGRLNRGLKLLSSGKRVITDRLHAHILSTLLDIPHIALDNNYGKISSYIEAWTHNYPALQTAKTAEEALSKLVLLPDK